MDKSSDINIAEDWEHNRKKLKNMSTASASKECSPNAHNIYIRG